MASNRLVSYGGVRRINGTISGFPKLEKRCRRHGGSLEEDQDRISCLPDEVLLLILSRLELKQQVSLSVLGHRWTHLWRFSQTLSFVFEDDISSTLEAPVYAALSHKFVHRVNSMLESQLLAATVDDFTVVFCSDGGHQRDIDAWLRFALHKRVKQLKFDLWYAPWPQNGPYRLCPESISNHRVDSLTSLYLCHVEVTNDFLNYLLSACPLLEKLSLKSTLTLRHITVSGPPAVKLKYLVVSYCAGLERFSISDVNHLQSLKVNCSINRIFIQNTPQLRELYLSGFYKNKDIEIASLILSRLPLLETLAFRDIDLLERLSSFPVFPKLLNLRKLKLEVASDVFPLGLCACLLEASPYLIEFKLKSWIPYQFLEEEEEDTSNKKDVERLDSPLRYLEVVEIAGFVGCKLDLAIAFYIIDHSKFIKKMIITTRRPALRLEIDSNKQEQARMIARELLGTRLPLQTQLTVN